MLVEVRGVSVSIDTITLLQSVDLEVGAGELVALTGANGSGKTTLLKTVAGLVPPSTGSVSVNGVLPQNQNSYFREQVAALIGVPPLARNLTLLEHLELIEISWGNSPNEAQDCASELLTRFGIGYLGSRFPHELSSGQQQLFSLCLTLVRPCSVLLLDEPEQRLDDDRRTTLATVLRERAASNTAILMATHSVDLIAVTGARTVPLWNVLE
ncbi:MAG: ABC transporter ATP-binding protein [Leucobacter sp.]